MAEQERYGPDVDPGESVASLFEKLIAMPWADDFEFRIEGPLSHPSRSHEVFPYALRLLKSENAVERYRAMDILGRLGNPRRAGPFTETVLRLAIQALQDPHPHVVRSAATVIRDWGTPQTEAILVTLASYPDPDVRICAAIGLAYKLEHLEILTALSRDPDDDIRDWATFGIAGIGVDGPVDTPEIRAALRTGWRTRSRSPPEKRCAASPSAAIRMRSAASARLSQPTLGVATSTPRGRSSD